ncbi:MAG: hypothetical protein IJC66_11425 [Kiritimatiellae bacterium]|nr:hypothetical protein [Kiritimatiellia bacterium]
METKILQFGEGNFLRCFIDWMVQRMNDKAGFGGKVRIIQPIGEELSPPSKTLNERGGRYHTCLRGVIGGKTVEDIEEVTCVEGVDLAVNVEQYATVPSIRLLVDGPFVLAQRSLELDYCGSKNQRLIDVAKSLAAGNVVLWTPPEW